MNQITYHQEGDYLIPDLTVGDNQPTYGKYGMLRKTFLKDHKPSLYCSLLFSGRLQEHLASIDQLARYWLDSIVEDRLKENPGPDKATYQMEWVCYMNNLKHSAEEVVLREIIYRE